MKQHKKLNGWMTLVCAAVALLLGGGALADAEEPARRPEASTLYARLGGYDFIAKFVDTAFPRVATNPQLRRLFQGHSQDSQIRQRQLIIDALCQAAGGPCAYTGRPMKPVHTGLGITGDDWKVFIGIISSTLAELPLDRATKEEFLDLFARRFRSDVVEKP